MNFNHITHPHLTQKSLPLPAPDTTDICIFPIKDFPFLAGSMNILSKNEHKKESSFRQEKDRLRFLTSRILLRRILSLYLSFPAKELSFLAGAHGKPYLSRTENDFPEIHFNLSHSGEFVALAFSAASPVGIDIEAIRANVRMETLVRRFFHPDEYSEFLKLGEIAQKDFMFRRWTVREAFLKGIGSGFSTPPDSFYVKELNLGSADSSRPHIFCIQKSQEDYSSWRVESIPAPDGYYGSVAYQAPV